MVHNKEEIRKKERKKERKVRGELEGGMVGKGVGVERYTIFLTIRYDTILQ